MVRSSRCGDHGSSSQQLEHPFLYLGSDLVSIKKAPIWGLFCCIYSVLAFKSSSVTGGGLSPRDVLDAEHKQGGDCNEKG